MKHLYIFDIHGYSANNGVGTYIKRLLDMVKTWKDFQVSMIMLQTNAEEFFVGQYQGMDYYFFPKSDTPYFQDNAEETCDLLSTCIADNGSNIFFVNYAPCEKLLVSLKQVFPKSRCIYAVHDLRCCWPLKGDMNSFRQIVLHGEVHEQQDLLMEVFRQEKKQFALADIIILFCEDTKHLLEECYQVPKEKLVCIPHGMDVQASLTEEAKRDLREASHIGDEKILLSVGRINRLKGFYDYLEAFKQILSRGYRCRWVIAGDARYIDEFREKAGDALNHITFTGFLEAEELYRWYQVADIGIVPSYFEQFGFVGLEMMANGLPVVASDGFGVRCMFRHRENTLVAEMGDRNEPKEFQRRLAERTIELLNDTSLQNRLRANSFERLKRDYSRKVMWEKYKRLLL